MQASKMLANNQFKVTITIYVAKKYVAISISDAKIFLLKMHSYDNENKILEPVAKSHVKYNIYVV